MSFLSFLWSSSKTTSTPLPSESGAPNEVAAEEPQPVSATSPDTDEFVIVDESANQVQTDAGNEAVPTPSTTLNAAESVDSIDQSVVIDEPLRGRSCRLVDGHARQGYAPKPFEQHARKGLAPRAIDGHVRQGFGPRPIGSHAREGFGPRPYETHARLGFAPALPKETSEAGALKRSFAEVLRSSNASTPSVVAYGQNATQAESEELAQVLAMIEASEASAIADHEPTNEQAGDLSQSIDDLLESIRNTPLPAKRQHVHSPSRRYDERTEWTLSVDEPRAFRIKREVAMTVQMDRLAIKGTNVGQLVQNGRKSRARLYEMAKTRARGDKIQAQVAAEQF